MPQGMRFHVPQFVKQTQNRAGKQFPARQDMKITAGKASGEAKVIMITVKMKSLKTDSGWDTVTKVPSKYKPVNLESVINQIMKLQ